MIPSTRLSLPRQLTLAALWFGIAVLWQGVGAIALPFILSPDHPGPGNPSLVDPELKNTALAILEGCGLVIAMIVQPAAGAISDQFRSRYGRRRPFILLGGAVGVVCIALLAGAPSFFAVFLVYALLQIAMNIAQGAYQGLLPDTVPPDQRGSASGFLGLATLFGSVAGAVEAGVFAPRMATLIAAITVGLCVAITLGIKEAPSTGPGQSTARRQWMQMLREYIREFAQYPDFCRVVLSRFLAFTALALFTRFSAFYIQDTFASHLSVFGIALGSAHTATSALFAVLILVGICVTYPAVRLSDRTGRKTVVMGACVSGALGSLLLTFAPSLEIVMFEAVFIAIAFGSLISVDWAFMTDLVPSEKTGKFLGFSNLATAGAQAIAPTFMGPVIDAVNSHSTVHLGYRLMFVVAAIFFAGGALILQTLKQQRLIIAAGSAQPN